MQGFVNDLRGTDFRDLRGWADHIDRHFPALIEPISDAFRQDWRRREPTVRRVIQGTIENILAISFRDRPGTGPGETTSPSPEAAAKTVDHHLENIGLKTLNAFADKQGIALDEALRLLHDRLERGLK